MAYNVHHSITILPPLHLLALTVFEDSGLKCSKEKKINTEVFSTLSSFYSAFISYSCICHVLTWLKYQPWEYISAYSKQQQKQMFLMLSVSTFCRSKAYKSSQQIQLFNNHIEWKMFLWGLIVCKWKLHFYF